MHKGFAWNRKCILSRVPGISKVIYMCLSSYGHLSNHFLDNVRFFGDPGRSNLILFATVSTIKAISIQSKSGLEMFFVASREIKH